MRNDSGVELCTAMRTGGAALRREDGEWQRKALRQTHAQLALATLPLAMPHWPHEAQMNELHAVDG
jgi:hypothetical protein